MRWRMSAFAAVGFGLLGLLTTTSPAAQASLRPRLLVLLVFDQMRGDYLQRWHDLFTDDGFRRLEREGTWFTNCHYPYACTFTGPGHASLATGCSPDRHGIIDNEWFDRVSGVSVNCATSDRYRNIVLDPPEGNAARARGGNPDRLLAPTFGDALKDATGGNAKVVTIALKDRSAVMPGGHKPDACYWFDIRSGTFCTSTYYPVRSQVWVNAYNRTRPADRWFDRTWDRLRPDLDYTNRSGPDDVVGEGLGVGRLQGRVFPHPMKAGLSKAGGAYYETVETSPFGNDLLLDFALRALDAEKLGTADDPDFLSIGFSSNDLVGHQYGPDSQEVMDITLRSDLIVRDLLRALDSRVGKGRYVVALSADHGICPLPEVSVAKGIDAQRVMLDTVLSGADAFLRQTYNTTDGGKTSWIQGHAFPWLYLNYQTVSARGLRPAEVAEVLARHLRSLASVQAVYTRQQIDSGIASDDLIGQRVRKAYQADRCGDVAVITKPYYLPTTYTTGTTHGSPHPYDTHVPLIIAGPGVPVGSSDEAVTPQAVVSVFARLAGIAPPARCDTPVPARLSK